MFRYVVQAISLIVTHRTDDASQPLPAAVKAPPPTVQPKEAKRPKLRLQNPPPLPQAPENASPESEQEEWEDIDKKVSQHHGS